jgi:small-conductance mechanosensitive channel/CRP-like cAMP-binding protein
MRDDPMFDHLADLHDLTSLETVGVGLAVVLLVVVRALLPGPARGLVRQPFAMLVLHVLALGLSRTLPEAAGMRAALSFVALLLLLASIGRSSVLFVLDVVLGRRLVRPLPRIVRDLTQGIVYVAVLLVTLRTAGVEPGSILTTSALLTAAIALSLQETLGNMVAGLAIQVQRPFDVDDWIQFDGETKHIGRVLEINWRATKVITLDEVEVIVPNATLAKAPITNFTKPHQFSRRSLYVTVPASVPPHIVQRTILEAISGSIGVLLDPPPSVVTNAFTEGNVEYWVRFFTELFDRRDGVDGAARDRIWYALSRIGVTPAAPSRVLQLHEVSQDSRAREEEERATERERALGNVDFLNVLTEDQKKRLAAESRMRMYTAGEVIVRQGDGSAEMFVVETGEVVVVRERTNGHGARPPAEVELARLGAGKFFGEMALTTGEPRAATVRASGPCTLLVIDHRALRGVLDAAPGLAEAISRVIAERQVALAEEGKAAPANANTEERTVAAPGENSPVLLALTAY